MDHLYLGLNERKTNEGKLSYGSTPEKYSSLSLNHIIVSCLHENLHVSENPFMFSARSHGRIPVLSLAISPWAHATVMASFADHFDVPARMCWWAFWRWTRCWLLSTWNTSLKWKKISVLANLHWFYRKVHPPTHLIISNDFSFIFCRSRMRSFIAFVTASCLKPSPSLAAFSAAPRNKRNHFAI